MFRIPFRFTPRSAIELAITCTFALVGFILFFGTTDEYSARKAFNRAMDSYVAGMLEDVYDALDDAMRVKPGYDAPREAYAKLLIDDARRAPQKLADAQTALRDLRQRQEARQGAASCPVLVGIAIAELEAACQQHTGPGFPAAALEAARSRLDDAATRYPDSGDVHVNLATLAYLQGDLARCRAELKRVTDAGNISLDALPILYNLQGLADLREQRANSAVAEFEKVIEFTPDSDMAYVNLVAAHAQVLVSRSAEPYRVDQSAHAVRTLIGRVRSAKSPLFTPICEILATHYLTSNNPGEASLRFAEAEQAGKLSWQGHFNQAVATYLNSRPTRSLTREAYAAVAAELTQALDNPKASERDKFTAHCILGTIEGERGQTREAIAHFRSAAAALPKPTNAVSRALNASVLTALGTLYYAAGEPPTAVEYVEKARELATDDEKKGIDFFLRQLRYRPTIANFSAKLQKIFTDYDLVVGASLALPGSPKPLGPENVKLLLHDDVTKTASPLPFSLNGTYLYAVALNLPQGRYRVELTLSDILGNREQAAGEQFEIDREAPRVLAASPAPGATVTSLPLLRFQISDTLNAADLDKLRVLIRYPEGTPLPSRTLVAGGKYQFDSASQGIKRGAPASTNVTAPLPAEKPPFGLYHVVVHVEDTKGKTRDVEWTFTLAAP